MKIYVDLVFVTNLVMDYILLRVTARMFRIMKSRMRCMAAASMGAAFSCLILYIPSGNFVPGIVLLHGGCGVVMLAVGMGLQKGSLLMKELLAMYLSAVFAGGVGQLCLWKKAGAAGFFCLAAAVYFCLITLLYFLEAWRAGRKNVYPITLLYQGKAHTSYGYYDTGNLLADPATGRAVSIIQEDLLEKVLHEELANQLKYFHENPGETESTELISLHPHYLTYETIGKRGMLLTVTLEELCIQTPNEVVRVEKPMFAMVSEPSALEHECKVLLNSRLLH